MTNIDSRGNTDIDRQGSAGFWQQLLATCERHAARNVGVVGVVIAAAIGCASHDTREQVSSVQTEALQCLQSEAASFPAWTTGKQYNIGDQVRYAKDGKVYSCIQAHKSQSDWSPPIVPALWIKPPSCGVQEWETNTGYNVGDIVTYQGKKYQSLSAAPSQPTWTPTATAGVLWSALPADLSCPAPTDSGFGTDLPQAATAAVGAIPAAFSTSPTGAAIYRVPLEVPPGRGAAEPQLAITYNSDADNELLGMHFGLDGLSAVTRCPSNVSDDGEHRAVQFDAGDHLCLDGLRLVPVSKDSTTTEYRTQPDTSQKVIGYLDRAHPELGPMSFRAFRKDGTIAEYGGRTDGSANSIDELSSRVMANGGVVSSWGISKVQDRVGNFMLYAYSNVPTADGDGDYTAKHMPTSIRYAGHQADGAPSPDLAPQRHVDFVYAVGARKFAGDGYVHGLHLLKPDLLKSIDMYGPDGLVRSYAFEYEISTQTGRDRLISVTEVAADGVKMPSTRFSWSDSQIAPSDTFKNSQEDSDLVYNGTGAKANALLFNVTADVDGDGIEDLVSFQADLGGSQAAPYRNTVRVARRVHAGVNVVFGKYDFGSAPLVWDDFAMEAALPVDYDHDGRTDLLLVPSVSFSGGVPRFLTLLHSNGLSFDRQVLDIQAPDASPFLADVDGDGMQDLIMCGTGPNKDEWEARIWANTKTPYANRTPIPAFKGFPCTLGQVVNDVDPTKPNAELYRFTSVPDGFAAIDLNGDGADELVVPENANNCLTPNQFGRPAHLFSVSWDWKAKAFTSRHDIGLLLVDIGAYRQLDFNGDGLADFIALSDCGTDDIHVLLNTGNGFINHPLPGIAYNGKELTDSVVLDTDGDGRKELLLPPSPRSTPAGGDPSKTPFELLKYPDFVPLPMHGILGGDIIGGDVPLTLLKAGDANNPNSLIWEGRTTGRLKVALNFTEALPDLVLQIQDGAHDGADLGLPDPFGLLIAYDGIFAPQKNSPEDDPFPTGYSLTVPCTYPEACVLGWKPVVRAYQTLGPAKERIDTAMSYQNGIFDRLGRGWLGFANIVAKHEAAVGQQNSLEIWNYNNSQFDGSQRFSTAGLLVDHATTSQSDGTCDMDRTHWDYRLDTRTRPAGLQTYRYSVATRSDQKVTGASCGQLSALVFPGLSAAGGTKFSEQKTELTPRMDAGEPDEAGNISSVTLTSSPTSKLVTTFQYQQEDLTNWLIGLPTLSTTTSTEGAAASLSSQTRQTSAAYDAHGLLVSTVRAPGVFDRELTTLYDRDSFGNVIHSESVGEENGATVTRQVCNSFDPSEKIFPLVGLDALAHKTSIKFDRDLGVPLQVLDPNAVLTKAAYDSFGRLAEQSRSDGFHASISRKAELVSGKDAAGNAVALVVRLHERTVASDGSDLEMVYDDTHRPTARLSFVVGHAGSDDARAVEEWEYGPGGVLVTHRFPHRAGDVVADEAMTYDGFGRLTARFHGANDAISSTIKYNGLETIATDELGHTTHVFRDANGRVVNSVDAKNGVTTYKFGPFGKLVEVNDPVGQTQPGHARSWQYDNYGLLKSSSDPDRGAGAYVFSAFGQLTDEVLADEAEQNYQYDLLERPVKLRTTDGDTVWTWDQGPPGSVGRLSSVSGPDPGTLKSYGYDRFGRLQSLSTESGALDAAFSYGYDVQGRLSNITYPSTAGTFKISFGFTKGYVTSVLDVSNDPKATTLWSWSEGDASNRVISDTLGAAATRTRQWDDLQQGALTQIVTKHGSQVLQNLNYVYDDHGDLTSRKDSGGWTFQGSVASPHTESFCYDELDRITDGSLDKAISCGHATGNSYHYAYDPDGNLTFKSGEGTLTYDPAHHPHAVSTITNSAFAFAYDALGNQIMRPRFADASGSGVMVGTPRIQYSALDLPKAFLTGNVGSGSLGNCSSSNSGTANCYCATISNAAGVPEQWCSDFPITFQYDGDGTRLRKDTPDLSSFYAGGLYERVTDRHTGTATHKYYIPTPAGRVATVVGQTLASGAVSGTRTVQYTLTDHASSADAVIDGSGNTVERHSYDPFGERRSPNWTPGALAGRLAADPTTIGYIGQQDDFELGLVNLNGRIYDPKIARFLTADPFVGGNALGSQSWNHYSYSANNPLSLADPSGFDYTTIDEAPDNGDDLEVTLHITGNPWDEGTFYITPTNNERTWGPANNFGWGDLSKVNAQPLVDRFNDAFSKGLTKTEHAASVAAVLEVLGPAGLLGKFGAHVIVVMTGIGIFDPNPAGAPPSDGSAESTPEHSVYRVAAGLGVAAIGPILGAVPRGSATPEQLETINNALGNNGGGNEPEILWHYTDAPASSFSRGLWSSTSVTNTPNLSAAEAVERLGLKSVPDKIIPIINNGHFIPNSPFVVQPHPLGSGGGLDFFNPRLVPASDILAPIPINGGRP